MKTPSNKPIVSIFVSYYNDEKFLTEHIRSILNQTYPYWELFLTNHASTDNSRNIAHSFKDPRIKHFDYPFNTGGTSALLAKKPLRESNGKYVKLFSADDYLLPNGLETLVTYMENHPEKDFAFGDVNYVDVRSRSLHNSWFKNRENFSVHLTEKEYLKRFFHADSIFPFAGQIIRKKALKETYLNNNFILLTDVYLWSSLLLNEHPVGFIKKPVACYRIHNEQLSSITKRRLVEMRCAKEWEAYRYLFLSAPNLEIIRYLCSTSSYAAKIENKIDIEFVLGTYFLNEFNSVTGYLILNDLFEKPGMVEYILKKFQFSMYDFRRLTAPFSLSPITSHQKRQEVRWHADELSFRQIFYLLEHKFRKNIKNCFSKKKKEFSC